MDEQVHSLGFKRVIADLVRRTVDHGVEAPTIRTAYVQVSRMITTSGGPNVAESEPRLRSSGANSHGRTDPSPTFRPAQVLAMTECLELQILRFRRVPDQLVVRPASMRRAAVGTGYDCQSG